MCEGGGNCLKGLKKRCNKKERTGNKKGGKLAQRVGELKSKETGTPLKTMQYTVGIDFVLGNSLFWAVKLNDYTTVFEKYKSIGFE